METSTIISLVSLLIAFTTFVLTQLRPAKIACYVGPSVRVYYGDHNLGGSLGIYVPVSFLNAGSHAGVITKAALTIYRTDTPQQQYLMQWLEFSKLEPSENAWVSDEPAHALIVPAKSTISKIVWFMWYAPSRPKFFLREGGYVVNFLYWEKHGRKPRQIQHKLYISEDIAQLLENRKTEKSNKSFDIILDKEFEVNRLLTEHEARNLLGS